MIYFIFLTLTYKIIKRHVFYMRKFHTRYYVVYIHLKTYKWRKSATVENYVENHRSVNYSTLPIFLNLIVDLTLKGILRNKSGGTSRIGKLLFDS